MKKSTTKSTTIQPNCGPLWGDAEAVALDVYHTVCHDHNFKELVRHLMRLGRVANNIGLRQNPKQRVMVQTRSLFIQRRVARKSAERYRLNVSYAANRFFGVSSTTDLKLRRAAENLGGVVTGFGRGFGQREIDFEFADLASAKRFSAQVSRMKGTFNIGEIELLS